MERYIVTRPENRNVVEVWSEKRLQFEPQGELKDLRTDLRAAVQMLKAKPNQMLHAVYGAQGVEFCAAENVLFYNVGPGFFTHIAGRGVRFKRSYSYPDPPQALLANHLHYHRYATVDANDTFSHWQPSRVLAKWSDVQLPQTASATTASSVWYHMKSGSVDICQLPSEELKRFG